jgi:hypothetical protein
MRMPIRQLIAATATSLAISLTSLTAWAQTVTLENITLFSGADALRLPKVVFEGANLGEAELRALFDPNQIDTLADRFRRLTARSVQVPEMRFEGGAAGSGVQFDRPDGLTFTDIQRGQARLLRLAPNRMTTDDPGLGKVRWEIGESGADDVDLGFILALLSDPRPPDTSQPKRTIYRNSFLESLFADFAGAFTIKIGRINAGDVRMRPLKLNFRQLLQRVDPGKPDQTMGGDQLREFILGQVDLIAASDYSAGDVDGIEMKIGATNADPDISLNIRRVRTEPIEDGVWKGFRFEGIELKIPDESVRVDSFAMKTIDLRPMIAGFGRMGQADPEQWLAANWRDVLPDLFGFTLDGVAVDVPFSDGSDQRAAFTIGKIDLALARHILGIPTDIGLTARETVIDVARSGNDPVLAPLLALGHRTIKSNDTMRLAWDEASQTMRLTMSSDIEKMGQFSFEGTLGNVPAELFGKDLNLIQTAALGAAFREARLQVSDKGLLAAVLDYVATLQGTTAEALRPQWAGVALGLPQLLGGATGLTELGQALSKFIAGGKSIIITAKANGADGLGLGEILSLADPLEILEKVDIKATAD